MKKQPAIEQYLDPTKKVTVLSVSPNDEDHSSLEKIIVHSKWRLFQARDLVSTLAVLKQQEITVLLCERDLRPGTWKDVLDTINTLPNSPSLIVSSRLADDRLWADALSLGAWDVLTKPFDRTEVIRSIRSAWQRWYDQLHMMRATAVKVMSAAS